MVKWVLESDFVAPPLKDRKCGTCVCGEIKRPAITLFWIFFTREGV